MTPVWFFFKEQHFFKKIAYFTMLWYINQNLSIKQNLTETETTDTQCRSCLVTFSNKNGVLNTLFVSCRLTGHCWQVILAAGTRLINLRWLTLRNPRSKTSFYDLGWELNCARLLSMHALMWRHVSPCVACKKARVNQSSFTGCIWTFSVIFHWPWA